MPTISRFYGIIIRMFYDDHMPPHFHAAYGEYELVIGISPITILEGKAPSRVRSLVLEWATLHQQELSEDWERCQNSEPPLPIEPLE
jgi:hypothetical protein